MSDVFSAQQQPQGAESQPRPAVDVGRSSPEVGATAWAWMEYAAELQAELAVARETITRYESDMAELRREAHGMSDERYWDGMADARSY